MGLCNLFQFLNMINVLVLSWMLHNVQSVPVSGTEASPVSVGNSATPTEGQKVKVLMGTDMESQKMASAYTLEKMPTTDVAIIKDPKDLQNNVMVSYLCDAGRGICLLDRNQDSTFSFLIPFPSHVKPPAQLQVKEFPVFGYKKSQFLTQSNVDPPIMTKEIPSHSDSIVLKRRRRDVQFSDLPDNEQQQPVYHQEGGALSEPEQVQQEDEQTDTPVEQSNTNNQQPLNSNQNSEEAAPQDNPSLLVNRQQVKRSAQTEEGDNGFASKEPNGSMSSGPEDKNSGQSNSAMKQQRRGTFGRDGRPRSAFPYQSNISPYFQPENHHNRASGSDGLNYRSSSDTDAGLYYSSDGQSASQDYAYNPYASSPYQSYGNYYNPSPYQSYQNPYYQPQRQSNYGYRAPMRTADTDAGMYYGKRK